MKKIEVMFGIINRVINSMCVTRIYIMFILISSILISCEIHGGISCESELKLYKEKWNYTIKRVSKAPNMTATYLIETYEGKRIYIQPKQYLISISDPGDFLIKEKNNEIAYVIFHDTRDTIASRIYSPTCDSIVIRAR